MKFMMLHKTDAYYESGGLPSKELIAGVGEMVGDDGQERQAARRRRLALERARRAPQVRGRQAHGDQRAARRRERAHRGLRRHARALARRGRRMGIAVCRPSSATPCSTSGPRPSRGTSGSARSPKVSRRAATSRCKRPMRAPRPARRRPLLEMERMGALDPRNEGGGRVALDGRARAELARGAAAQLRRQANASSTGRSPSRRSSSAAS